MLSVPTNTENTPFVIRTWQFSHLEGKLLTILETLNLADKQELAVKSLVRQAIWRTPDPCIRLTDEQVDRCLDENRHTKNHGSPELEPKVRFKGG
jgi:hypothetical protein